MRVAQAGFDCRVVFGFGDLFIERDLENSSPNIVSTGQMFDDGFPEALSWVDLHTGHHALPEHRGVRQRF